jgi:hypothetical protein
MGFLPFRTQADFIARTGIEHGSAAVDITVLSTVLDYLDPTSPSQVWEAAEDYGK